MSASLLSTVASAVVALVSLAPAYAAEPDQAADAANQSGLQEIIVTATRRDSNLQTTPVAVTALNSNMIRQSNPRDIGDLAAFVPNFSASTITGFNAASFAMRGVGQNNIIVYFEPPVAVLVDDFVVPSVQTQLLDTFDIAQVEVLRGPQGTLFGKNTTGGAVTVHTKRPIMNQLSEEGRVEIGNFATRNFQGAINIPVIQNKLAVRLVGGYEKDHGYYRNGGCYGPVTGFNANKWNGTAGCLNGAHIGGKDVLQGRAKVLFTPTDRITVLFQAEALSDHSGAVPSVNENYLYTGSTPFLTSLLHVANYNGTGDPLNNAMITNRDNALLQMSRGQRISVNGYYLNIDIDMNIGKLTSVSGIRKQKSRLPNSYSGGAAVASDGEVLSIFDARRDDDRKTWQQELRFATKTGGPFDAVFGAYYQQDKVNFCVAQVLGFLNVTGTGGALDWNNTPYVLCNAQKSKSAALFAEGTYKFGSKLTLTAGGRYNRENKTWLGRQQVFAAQLNGGYDPTIHVSQPLDYNVFAYPAGVIQLHDKESEMTYRASLGYQATRDIFAYATFSHGFKAGGYNDQIGGFSPFGADLAAFAEAAQATKPEYADSFEAGVKSELFDRHVRFNLTGFYVKYKNLQKQLNVPIVVNGAANQVTRFVNAASATVKGIELETSVVPMKGLTIRGVLGYQDAKYDSYDVPPGPGGQPGAGYNLALAPMDRAPEWQTSLNTNYETILTPNYKLTVNGEMSYVSRNLFTQSITELAGNTFLNSRTLLNASVTVAQVDNAYYLRLIGRNLSDVRYRTAQQNVAGLWLNSQFGAPRYFGVELGFKLAARR